MRDGGKAFNLHAVAATTGACLHACVPPPAVGAAAATWCQLAKAAAHLYWTSGPLEVSNSTPYRATKLQGGWGVWVSVWRSLLMACVPNKHAGQKGDRSSPGSTAASSPDVVAVGRLPDSLLGGVIPAGMAAGSMRFRITCHLLPARVPSLPTCVEQSPAAAAECAVGHAGGASSPKGWPQEVLYKPALQALPPKLASPSVLWLLLLLLLLLGLLAAASRAASLSASAGTAWLRLPQQHGA